MRDYSVVAAVGSSFAAGPGIEPIIDSRAMRSGDNYAHLLARALNAELTDLTISGATTASIVDTRQRMLWRTLPPQVPSVPQDSELVTITAGGNDLGYIASMLRIAWSGRLKAKSWTRPAAKALGRKPVPVVDVAAGRSVASGLTRIVESVRARAPHARIVLVDYLTVVGEHTTFAPETPFEAREVAALQELGDRLATAFENAAEQSGTDLVRASKISVEHALGSSEPWVFGFRPTVKTTASSFHPNAAGMRAVADEIYRTIQT